MVHPPSRHADDAPRRLDGSRHIEDGYVENVAKIVRDNIAKESRLHIDESALYKKVCAEFPSHERVSMARGIRSR